MASVMETFSVCAASISDKIYTSDHLKALYMNESQYTCDALKLPSLDEIGLCLSESLHIGDGPKMSSNAGLCQPIDNVENLNVCNDADYKDLDEIDTIKVPLSTIFTNGNGGEGVNDTAEEIKKASCESSKTAHPRSLSLPTPLKLVSAIKGTREKLGASRDKLSVTWAPDVYDPPPSAPSTAVINHKPRRKSERKKSIDSKKNGKNKQKKKSSKGSSSKDKKPVQKYSKGTNFFYNSFEGEGKMVVESFDCGSTFLKTSVTHLHFSATEAT